MAAHLTHIQPQDLFTSRDFCYSQVVSCEPGKQVFVAGQVAWDQDMNLIGGTSVAEQAEQALKNLRTALEAGGASIADIVMLRMYIVDYKSEYLEQLMPVLKTFFAGCQPPANTLLGVQSLAVPGLLVEIDAQAVVALNRREGDYERNYRR